LLAPDGLMLVNVADGPPMPYARSQAATITEAVGPLLALAESGVLKGRRFGNVVLAASPAGIPRDWESALRAAGPHPGSVFGGEDLLRFTAGAPVTTDATATGSPAPGRGVLRFTTD